MHLAVLIKQIHPLALTRIHSDAEADAAGYRISRLDEHALEEALRIKESMPGVTLTLLSVGPEHVTESLRRGLGMGADGALHIRTAITPLCATETAVAFCPAIKALAPDLILCGAMSEDLMQGMTGPCLAAMLRLPFTSQVIRELRIAPDARTVEATRDAGGGIRQEIRLPLPCLVSVQQGFNTPRYPHISHMLTARARPIESRDAPPAECTALITGTSHPARRGRGLRIQGTPAEQATRFVACLKERQVVQGQ